MKTFTHKGEYTDRQWYVVDANEQVLGRLATRIATILRGKHKPIFSPHIDTGDFIVVVNADKIRLTGNKSQNKVYYRHTEYPGGLKATSYDQMKQRHPERIIEKAVRGMLPKNSLGRQILKKLKIYVGSEHPHQAQNPEPLDLSTSKMVH
jgi:large subunit ribosomal protein L13